ncbi:hypothetical protein BDW60DRAFT_169738 [Aspergillus nidulans var. acristatus]
MHRMCSSVGFIPICLSTIYIGFAPYRTTETVYLANITLADSCVRAIIQSKARNDRHYLDACKERCRCILTVCGGQKRR